MSLTKLEFRKIFTPLTIIALIVMLLVNLYAIFAHQGIFYINATGDMTLSATKARIAKISGPIDDEWIAARKAEMQAILDDPKYQKTDKEIEDLRKELTQSWYIEHEDSDGTVEAGDLDAMESMIEEELSDPFNMLNAGGIAALANLETYINASSFYSHAERHRDTLLKRYSDDKEICADITARYDRLANDYTVCYDYDLAYDNIQYAIANIFPYTVGVPVLVGLAPLFARERSRKTDSLILSSKRGRRCDASAKIYAGTLYSVLVWFVMAASLCVYALSFFGVQGFDATWQTFTDITSPYLWTFGQAVIIELGTSLVGTLFFGFIIMFLSELTKSMFVSIIIGAVVLLVPMILSFNTNIVMFLPTCIMAGIPMWSEYFPAKLFGNVIPMPYLSIAVSCILCIVFGLAAVGVFSRRQAA